MDAIERTQYEYLLQQGLDYVPANVRDCWLEERFLHLLYEDAMCWIVLYKEESDGKVVQFVVNVVYKDMAKRMIGIEA